MSDQPTVRLLSCTAYPLETLYVAAVSLDDPEVHFQKPEEIRMLLYTELSQHLKSEHKEFILNTMRELVNADEDPIGQAIRFLFIIDGVTSQLYSAINEETEDSYACIINAENMFPDRMVWNTSIRELADTYRGGIPILKQLAIDACETLLEVDPYLHQLLTEK